MVLIYRMPDGKIQFNRDTYLTLVPSGGQKADSVHVYDAMGDAMRKTLYDYCTENGCTDLLSEWDTEMNGGLTPHDVAYGSKKHAYWRCAHGHRWQAALTSRTGERTKCPYCTGRLPVPGENDLATLFPQLAAEWDAEKNTTHSPEELLPGSHRYVWWRCGEGHSWRASVKSRTSGTGCPVCSNRRLNPGENDLAAASPQLAAEWDDEKNYPLRAKDVFPGSSRKVWWRCPRGHSWSARISSRVEGAGCPYCTGKRVEAGFNDLASRNPQLAAEWDAEKNAPLSPDEVTPFSNRKVWWRCSQGHEFLASISSRSSTGSGCPYCTGRKVLPGFNDLASQEPKVAAQWAQDLNGELTPEMVTTGSHKKVWWRCAEGHIWRAVIFTRARGAYCGCPVCAGRVKQKRPEIYTHAAPPGAKSHQEEENRL